MAQREDEAHMVAAGVLFKVFHAGSLICSLSTFQLVIQYRNSKHLRYRHKKKLFTKISSAFSKHPDGF